jgi:hypothetical protein
MNARTEPQASKPVINDDDLYVIELGTRTIVEQHGSSSIMAQAVRRGYLCGVKPGQALVRGMQARHLLGAV